MTADPLHDLQVLTQSGLPPADLIIQAATLISRILHADWSGLLTTTPTTHTYQIVHHRSDLPTPLLTYLEQRTRSNRPLGRLNLETTHPTYVDHYPDLPDAKKGAVSFGINAVAHLPLGTHNGQTYVMTVVRTSPTILTRSTPWTHDERAFMDAATRTVRKALMP